MKWKSSQNEKRKKWEESKGTAFIKGKNKAAWEPVSEVITTRPERTGTWPSVWLLAVRERMWEVVRASAESAVSFTGRTEDLRAKEGAKLGHVNLCGV